MCDNHTQRPVAAPYQWHRPHQNLEYYLVLELDSVFMNLQRWLTWVHIPAKGNGWK